MANELPQVVIDLQIAVDASGLPTEAQFRNWIAIALEGRRPRGIVTVRLCTLDEMQSLNRDYRGKDAPTNILSFPFELPEGMDDVEIEAFWGQPLPEFTPQDLLGDLVVCAEVVAQEAQQQSKPLEAHWAHRMIHGTLHLLGFDHIEEEEAMMMEGIEIQLMNRLGYADPYQA